MLGPDYTICPRSTNPTLPVYSTARVIEAEVSPIDCQDVFRGKKIDPTDEEVYLFFSLIFFSMCWLSSE